MAQRERTTAANGTNCPTCPQGNTKQIKIGRRYYNKPPEEVEKISLADLQGIDVSAEAEPKTEAVTADPKQVLFDKCIKCGIKFKKTQSAETIQSLIDEYEAKKNV